ncbi:adenosine receptor A3-like [Acropora millepora]|uniref:adenosine receptor A3-like n=1 Tax=Acropora millepora TaxID=45264 RepID=UPI001CF563C8|nr:adenosine receptor A3-like [Acropora millepora]
MLFLTTSDSLSYILWMCPQAVKQVINALINLVKRQTLPRCYQRNSALKLPAMTKIFVDEGYTTFFVTLNVFLSVIATIGNLLVLVALRKVTSINPPTKLLFRCLAATDLCVGLIEQPLFVTLLLTDFASPTALHYVSQVYSALNFILCGVSLATAATTSIDRLLALILGLSYKLTVTVKRVRIVLIIFWLASFSVGFSYYIGLYMLAYGSSFGFIFLCIFASVFSLTKIALKLRQQQAQVQQRVEQEQVNGEIALNIARYKKMVRNVAWLQMALIVCYMPSLTVILFRMVTQQDEKTFFYYSAITVLFMNSSVNPILYCWRIGEVKKEVKNTLKQIFQRSST